MNNLGAENNLKSNNCEGQKVPQSPKSRKNQGNEKVTLGVGPKVTKK